MDLQIDLGDGEMYNPYDPTVPDQIAAWAEDYGHTVPGAPREVFGSGWWKFDTDAAAKLLMKAGLSQNGSGQWLTPDGEVWSLDIQSDPSENDAISYGSSRGRHVVGFRHRCELHHARPQHLDAESPRWRL